MPKVMTTNGVEFQFDDNDVELRDETPLFELEFDDDGSPKLKSVSFVGYEIRPKRPMPEAA